MNVGQTVFSQLMDRLPSYEFQKCVERYRGDAHHRGFSCRDRYLTMAFAQLTYRESLRDIAACLGAMRGKLYHMGFRGRVTRSTLQAAISASISSIVILSVPLAFEMACISAMS